MRILAFIGFCAVLVPMIIGIRILLEKLDKTNNTKGKDH